MCGEESSEFVIHSRVGQGCSIFFVPFNYAIDWTTIGAAMGHQSVQLGASIYNTDLKFSNDVVGYGHLRTAIQTTVNRLTILQK